MAEVDAVRLPSPLLFCKPSRQGVTETHKVQSMPSISRRVFVGMSASAVAAARLPIFAQAVQTERPLGFAAVGLGTISGIFMRGCAASQAAKVAGLVTGHPETKGKRYGQQYTVPETSVYTYETFDRIRDNRDIEAVYIGLPNSMHCEFTVRA